MRELCNDPGTISIQRHEECPHDEICHVMLKIDIKGREFKITKKGNVTSPVATVVR